MIVAGQTFQLAHQTQLGSWSDLIELHNKKEDAVLSAKISDLGSIDTAHENWRVGKLRAPPSGAKDGTGANSRMMTR